MKKLKMNGGEGAGTFHVYKRNKTVSSKEALKRLFQYCRDKFPKEQKDQKEQKEQKVKRKGKVKLENAEEKLFKSATNERLGRCE